MNLIETLGLTLVRAVEDDASFSPGYQVELRQFYNLVRAEGTQISADTFAQDSIGGGAGLTGEFSIPLGQAIGATLGRAAMAWLQGRTGRTLRFKVGEVETEAKTLAVFDRLLAQAIAAPASQSLPELECI